MTNLTNPPQHDLDRLRLQAWRLALRGDLRHVAIAAALDRLAQRQRPTPRPFKRPDTRYAN